MRMLFKELSGLGSRKAQRQQVHPRRRVRPANPHLRSAVNWNVTMSRRSSRSPTVCHRLLSEQPNALLKSMYTEANLSPAQLEDFRDRVYAHLRYVAVERQINPREIKRFLDHTLQTLVRPELDRDCVLPLQTLLFRYDWRTLYDWILTDSMLFVDALIRYRDGEDHAFEDLSPELRVLPLELGEYLRLDVAEPLCRNATLDPYISSLEAASTTPPWLTESYQYIGRLRKQVRRARADSPSVEDRLQLAGTAKEVVSRLRRMTSQMGGNSNMSQLLNQIEARVAELEVRDGDETSRQLDAGATNECRDWH